MNKLLLFLLSMALLLAAAGCSNNNSGNSSSAPQSSAQSEDGEEPGEDDLDQDADDNTVRDDHLEMSIALDNDTYTVNDVITATVTVRNIGDERVAYVIGSGSNIVPDALKVTLGEFANLHTPAMQTMDYGTSYLEPGETLEYDCRFVPYMAGDEETAMAPVDPDSGLDFFQEGNYTAAEAGAVDGTATFTYFIGVAGDSESGDTEGADAAAGDAQLDDGVELEDAVEPVSVQADPDGDYDADASGLLDGDGVEGVLDGDGVDGMLDGDGVDGMLDGGPLGVIDQGNEQKLVLEFTLDIADAE